MKIIRWPVFPIFFLILLLSFPLGSQNLSLKKLTLDENKKNYTINAEYPELVHWEQQKVQKKVNEKIQALVSQVLLDFRRQFTVYLKDPPINLPSDMHSSLGLHYQVLQETNKILSMVFEVSTYFAGAAHPNSHFLTLNFDLKTGKALGLPDLFKKNSHYLKVIADFSIRQLLKKGQEILTNEDWVRRGAAPQESNYRNFVLTPGGLEILFNSYQVAPYAAGPQRIRIPYSALKPILKPGSVMVSPSNPPKTGDLRR